MAYVGSLQGIESLFNAFSVIKARLDHDPDVARHTIVKAQYSTYLSAPSVRYTQLLERMLADRGYPWRIHSVHVDCSVELVKILLRPPDLNDLITEDLEFSPLEVRLLGLLSDLALAMDKEPITQSLKDLEWPLDNYLLPAPSTLRVFTTDTPNNFRLIFKSVFDVWYHDGTGWTHVNSDGDERPQSLARELSGLSP